ncbi:DUF6170 family protein [Aliidiomarina soli]|uniref:Uncharacterized protein n=1 Tax=Aliidiomarina soli TaxID=1928574 RepID=A0A432WCY6_9GAMM|nr:DUF6170 family protein [Aliidiomarina soli]RUO30272.1 hypothetical protein CWE14_12920 [Aliidiomarina soli]
MKLYWSARKIPELAPFRATERAQIIQLAAHTMPLPRRYLTNFLKLLVLAALFWQLVTLEGWGLRIVALLAAGLFYPLLLHPLTLNLARPYLKDAAEQFQQQAAATGEEEDTKPPTPPPGA